MKNFFNSRKIMLLKLGKVFECIFQRIYKDGYYVYVGV